MVDDVTMLLRQVKPVMTSMEYRSELGRMAAELVFLVADKDEKFRAIVLREGFWHPLCKMMMDHRITSTLSFEPYLQNMIRLAGDQEGLVKAMEETGARTTWTRVEAVVRRLTRTIVY